MNTGIDGGINLAWKLKAVFAGGASEAPSTRMGASVSLSPNVWLRPLIGLHARDR
jgi:hypothetical protein